MPQLICIVLTGLFLYSKWYGLALLVFVAGAIISKVEE